MIKIIGKYISILSRNKKAYFKRHLAHLNIGEGQYIILIQLFKNTSLSQERLADILAMDKATITRAIRSLQENGYLNIEKNQNDRRENILFLTEKCLGIKDEFFSIIKKWNEMLISDIDEDERQILFSCLEKISQKAVKLNKENKKNG
jgi:DNA-binding MarR family transcriptional regulator